MFRVIVIVIVIGFPYISSNNTSIVIGRLNIRRNSNSNSNSNSNRLFKYIK